MNQHPLDNCEPAKKLEAMATEELRKRANKICEVPGESLSDTLDKIFENNGLDLTLLDVEFDQATGELKLFANVVVPVGVKSVELFLEVEPEGICPDCGEHH